MIENKLTSQNFTFKCSLKPQDSIDSTILSLFVRPFPKITKNIWYLNIPKKWTNLGLRSLAGTVL